MSRIFFSLRMLLLACMLVSPSFAQTATTYANAINGRVVDAATSAPLAGVRVYWGLRDSGRYPVHQYVVTNLEGRFRLENKEPALYYLIAAAGDYGRRENDALLPPSGSITALFRLEKGGASQTGMFGGLVRNAVTHAGIARAWVGYRLSENANNTTTTTGNGGEFGAGAPVPIGEYQVSAAAKGFSSSSTVVIVKANTNTVASLMLQPNGVAQGSVTGKITDYDTSAPLAGAKVVVQNDLVNTQTLTNANGEYRLNHIPSSLVTVLAFKDGYMSSSRGNVAVPVGDTVTVNLKLRAKATILTGNIAGVLKTAGGQPLPNVRVYYYNSATSVTRPYCTTDIYGQFKIQNLIPGRYTLAASTTGYLRRQIEVNVYAGQTTDAILILQPEGHYGTLSGTVKNAVTKAPIAGARVYYRPATTSATMAMSCVVTNLEGRYTVQNLRVGEYQLVVEAAGFVSARGTVAIVENTTRGINFELQPIAAKKGSLVGVVLDAKTSAPLAGARVVIQRCLEPAGSAINITTETRTNENGEFAFNQIPAGQANVVVFKDGYYPGMRTAYVPPDGVGRIVIRLQPRPQTGKIVGTVKTLAEEPIPGAVVRLAPVTATACAIVWPPDFKREILTDRAGHYVFEGVPVGSYQVIVSKAGYRQQGKPVTVQAGTTVEVNFRLEAAATVEFGRLAGRVIDAATSAPIASAWVAVHLQVTNSLGATPTRLVTYTNSLGYYEFGRVPVGTWAVYAAKRGYLPGAQGTTIVKDTTTKLNFKLQRITTPGVIAGNVADTSGAALANVHVIVPLIDLPHMANDNTALHAVTNANGYYRIAGVPAGNQKVVAFAREFIPKTQTVAVVSGTTSTLDFVLDRRTTDSTQTVTINVISSRSGAPLAGVLVGAPVCDYVEPFSEWDLFQAVTGMNGSATLSGIPLGSFVVGSLASYQPGFVQLPNTTSPSLAEGSNSITLILTPEISRNAARTWWMQY